MIRVDVEQGTKAWLDAKIGIPGASSFHKIITPKTGKMSASAAGYCHELLAEQLIGRPLDDATSDFMQRGTIMEHEARKWYELQTDYDVEQVGFLLRDDRSAGCSPDGLIGTDGGLEIKCPAAHTHVGYLLGDAQEKYRCQIQGGLWITERQWWDFCSYNPELPPVMIRFQRDDEFIAKLAECVAQFTEYMHESKLKLQAMGLFEDFEFPPMRIVA